MRLKLRWRNCNWAQPTSGGKDRTGGATRSITTSVHDHKNDQSRSKFSEFLSMEISSDNCFLWESLGDHASLREVPSVGDIMNEIQIPPNWR